MGWRAPAASLRISAALARRTCRYHQRAQRFPCARRRYRHQHAAHLAQRHQAICRKSLSRRSRNGAAACVRRYQGARGNSGVILSQILNGFARATEGKPSYTAQDLADALKRASDSAYNAVMKPVEGTILTVIRAIAESAAESARNTSDIREQFNHVTSSARRTLRHRRRRCSPCSKTPAWWTAAARGW
ncbi:MAG: DAK2 domain-containing protein [Caldilineaceae bacterium]